MYKIKLSKLQQDTLLFFGKNSFGQNFYWTGGTALAYCYLCHRYSVDLDFFSHNLFNDDEYLIFVNQLKRNLNASKITLTKQYNRRLYMIRGNAATLKLELVYFPFPGLERRKRSQDFFLKIDSLTDIMVNKVLSTYQRDEAKDVYDLFYYLNHQPKYRLFGLIKLVEKKFGIAIEPTLFLAKANELSAKLSSLQLLLLKKEKNLSLKAKSFFQELFNARAAKQIK
jgi:predicted nucleotidyltransferase component of viral defense system